MRAIHVLFYKPSAGDHWINHLVTSLSPPFSHCDLQFDDGTATSVYQWEAVYMEKKNFTRLNYERISITLDDHEYQQVWEFCQAAFKAQVRFDMIGMALSRIPIGLRKPSDRTYCSRYVIEALQKSGRAEFNKLNPLTTSPSTLHTALDATGKGFIHISEARMKRLT